MVKIMTVPMISVLMPVFNGEKYLAEAIESILNQTFTDFEFIIINDGSTDSTEKIILSYNDSRISYYKNKINLQLIETLNKGIKLSKGKYIARMDADDISYAKRFEKQLSFMEANKDVDICGTWIKIIGSENEIWRPPVNHDEIVAGMLFESMIYHPTVMLKRDKLLGSKQLYSKEFRHAEDYEFWIRLSRIGFRFANINEPLLEYRIHNNKIGRVYYEKQKQSTEKVIIKQMIDLGITTTEKELNSHYSLRELYYNDNDSLRDISKYMNKLVAYNVKKQIFSERELKKELAERWFVLCYNSTANGLCVFFEYYKQSLSKAKVISLKQKIKFFIKCLYNVF